MNLIAAQRVCVTTADGLALETRQIGPDVADMTVILLHGLLGDTGSWRHQTTHLTSRHPDIRVIAYDHRGARPPPVRRLRPPQHPRATRR